MKRFVTLVLVIAMVFSLGSVAFADESKDTIKVAIPRDFTALDGFVGNATSYGIAWSIFDTLVDMDGELNVSPRLATAWEQIDDLTWRIMLREGVSFTNGAPFNAESAAYSVNYMASLDTGYTSWKQWGRAWPPVAEVESEYSILIKTAAPCAVMPQMLARGSMVPLNAYDDESFASNPVGTGPYMLKDWNVGVSVDLEVNPNYWGGASKIKNIHYDIMKSGDARAAALRTGEYDYIADVPFDTALEMMDNPIDGMDLVHINTISLNYLYFNGNSENRFIQDPNFRKALTYAIDTKGIVEYIFGGLLKEAKNITAMGVDGTYDAGGWPEIDSEKAMALAKECGYNGEEIKFVVSGSQFNYDGEVVELIVTELQEAGFNVTYEEVDSATWASQYKSTGAYDISTNNYGGSYTKDAEMYYTQGIKNNGWKFDAAEAALDVLYSGKQSTEERTATLKELVAACWNETPYLWCSEGCVLHAAKSNLHGYEVFTTNGQLNFIDAYVD